MSDLNLQLNEIAYQNFGFNIYLTKDTLDLDEEIPVSEATQVYTTWSISDSSIEGVGVSKLETGTITSQTITLAVEDGAGDTYIASGKTDFDNTTAGFILGVDDSDSNKPKFYIGDTTHYVNWDGTTLTIAGGVTSATALIGALTLGDGTTNGTITFNHKDGAGDTYITAGKTDFDNDEAGFILGIDDNDADKAKFYIGDTTSYLNWNGSSLTINTPVITNLASGTEIAIQGWTHDMTFSASDADTVAWTSGTITLTNGVTYSIDAGNTGNMAAETYIYLDIGTSVTVLQTTTTKADAVGSGKIMICVAENKTGEAEFVVFGSKDANFDGSKIIANSITTNELAANSVTATEINVTNLAAINADMGAITAGTITLDTSGHIKGGQTAYNTGTGFWLGYDSTAYKFSIGVGGSSTNSLTWDGTDLTVNGYVVAGKAVFGGDGSDGALSVTADTNLDFSSANILVKNYTSITIDATKTLGATNVPSTGGVMWLKCTGNCTINGKIDMSGKGSSGGAGGAGSDGPDAGGDGDPSTEPYYIISNNTATGGEGSPAGANIAGAGGGGGGMKVDGSTGGSSGAAAGGTGGTKIQGYNIFMSQYPKSVLFSIGSGGAGGGGGEFNGGTGGDGGAGGAGGGVIIIEVAGNLTFGASSTIDVSGVDGSNGETGTRNGGGGGGGAGGVGRILYNGTLTDGGVTKTVAGGSGGTGGGSGGAGSTGEVFVEANKFIL